jgi:hypothetical protein
MTPQRDWIGIIVFGEASEFEENGRVIGEQPVFSRTFDWQLQSIHVSRAGIRCHE